MEGGAGRGIELQERDFAILRGLYESRLMTTVHAATLYFEGRLEATRKRLQRLKAAGLVRNREKGAGEAAVLQLTMKGYGALKDNDQLHGLPPTTEATFAVRSKVSSLTLRHELAVIDVKAALSCALAKEPGTRLLHFSTWPRLSAFKVRSPLAQGYGVSVVTVKPDGFLHFAQDEANAINEHFCFLEVDRGTASNHVLAERAANYRTYYRSGGFAEFCGGIREHYDAFPFRVLTVFKSAERRDNFAQRLLSLTPPIKTMVWLTTFPQAVQDPLGAIWIRPSEHVRPLAQSDYLSLVASRLIG